MVKVILSSALAGTGGLNKEVNLQSSTVRQILLKLAEQLDTHFRETALDEIGNPMWFVNIYVNGSDVRLLGCSMEPGR